MNSSLTPLTFLFLKSSFFILYLQLFGHLKALRVCSIIGLGISSAAYAAFAISIFVLATPSGDDTWLAHQTTKSMKAVLSMSVPQSVFGLVVDLCILLIPIVGVWGLNMSLKRKIGVILIFFSGAM